EEFQRKGLIGRHSGDGGRADCQKEQQGMQPPAVLELGRSADAAGPHGRDVEIAGIVAITTGEPGIGHVDWRPVCLLARCVPARYGLLVHPIFWRSLPGLKRMVRPGGIRTSLPVRGLRPIPRFLGLTWNTPKPRSSIRSPRCMEIRIASNTASTATSALTLVMSAMRDTSLTMSTLIMLTGSSGSVNSIYIVTYAVKLRPN